MSGILFCVIYSEVLTLKTQGKFRMKNIFDYSKKYKSHWYYWYTGQKITAALSMVISALIVWGVLFFIVGFSLPLVSLIVVLDAIGFWLVILYFFILRPYFPEFANIQDHVDSFVIYNLLATLLMSIFVNRVVTFLVAKRLGVLPVDPGKAAVAE